MKAAAFTRDGSKLALAREQKKESVIEVYDCASGAQLARFDVAPDAKRKPSARLLRFDAAGRQLAGILGGAVTVWRCDEKAREFSPGRQIGKLDPPVYALDFSADGTLVYVGTGVTDEARAVSIFSTEEPPKKAKSKKAPAKRR
jgi:hypothetical protein